MTPVGAEDLWAEQRRLPLEEGIRGKPVVDVLPKGMHLWRVHPADRDAAEFSVRPPDAVRGGRFDSPGGSPGVLYAADSLEGAVAEVLLRDVPLADDGARAVPLRQLLGRSVSILEVTGDLGVVSLHGPDAAQIGQGLWLTKCDPVDYAMTRAWGVAIRSLAGTTAGFVWRARHDEDRLAYVLYADTATGVLRPHATVPIDDGDGLEAVRKVLLAHRAIVLG